MAVTYTLAKMFLARNRMRRDLRDTDTSGAARFQDEELDSFLDDTAVRHFFYIVFVDASTPLYTDATVEIVENGGGTDVELILTRVDTPDVVNRFNLSDPRYDTIDELFKAIRDLAAGWNIGVARESDFHWLFEKPDSAADKMMLEALHGFASRDLQLFASASVYTAAERRLLGRYQVDLALKMARGIDRGAITKLKSYQEDDVKWTYPTGDELGDQGDSSVASNVPIIAFPLY